MTFADRRSALAALFFVLLALPLSAQRVPWDEPAFSADPKALIAAAQGVTAGDSPTVLLLDEAEFVIREDGQTRSTERVLRYIAAEAGVEYATEVSAYWAPWFSDRPTIAARVITKEGTVHELDQAAIVENPAPESGVDIFSDTRILRAPLPAVAVGSVVETVIVHTGRNPVPGAGTAEHYYFGGWSPTERTRVTLDFPAGFEPHIVNKSGVEPRSEERDGRRRLLYETGRIEGKDEFDQLVPYDVTQLRYLAFSTGKSWQEIATKYAEIVDKQLAGNELEPMVRKALGKAPALSADQAADRKEIVARLLAAIQKDIRYAGVEIGEGSIIPRTPKQVLTNKYGDCKDKATLLVGMLRVAGIPAHVALLRAGSDFDISGEQPGLSRFNHAIVVVEGAEGDEPIWVDPTDVYSRAGELPIQDQGRNALVARAGTTTLTRIPEAPPVANLYRERRTFVLPENGKAKVTEVTEPAGTHESWLRRWVLDTDAKTLRENLEGYAERAYVAKKLERHEFTDARDLTRPFRLTLEVPESRSGLTANGEGSVAVNVGALVSVPEILRNWEEPSPDDDPKDAAKKRTHDFLFPQPSVREWLYKVILPVGYVPRTLPQNETRKLGTTTLTKEFRAEEDGSVSATFRFDSGKRRLTPAEFEETRIAISKLMAEDAVHIGFELAGQAKLNAGDVRGALAEFRRLAGLHPKEAQHHLEIGRALLAGGLGEAARDEVRRAVAIEPKSALAHQTLGHVLLHDSLGRQYRKGFDRAGAIAALRKAKELDPQELDIRVALANALTYGDDGSRFGRGANLAEAVEEFKAMSADLGAEGKAMEPELTVIYAHMGRFAEMRELGKTLEDTQQRALAGVIATAALDGADAALRELNAFDQQRRRSYAAGAAQLLMQVRLYPQAATLMEAGTQGTAGAAEARTFIDLLRTMKRIEEIPAEEGPKSLVTLFFTSLLNSDQAAMRSGLPDDYADDLDSEEGLVEVFEKHDFSPPEGMSRAVLIDVVQSMIHVQQEGDEENGYRLRMRTKAGPSEGLDEYTLLARREKGRWVLRGGAGSEQLTGDSILKLLSEGKAEAARKWLNWLRDDVKAGSSDDPLDGTAFTVLWPKDKAEATEDELRIAGAVLATHKTQAAKSEPLLVKGRETARTDAAKNAIDLALAQIYQTQGQWTKMAAVTERLLAANPSSPTAFSRHVAALLGSGRTAEVVELAKKRAERLPNERDALRALSRSAATSGDYAAAQSYALKLIEERRPVREDYTAAAWLALFTGEKLDNAIELARLGTADDKEKKGKAASLNTLAALYAETGKNVEAREALLQGLEADNRIELKSDHWYVLGRIAENYGVNDHAIRAYERVSKETGPATSRELAQRRLEGLKKKK